MSKFEVGDKARIIGKPVEWQSGGINYMGQIVTILEPLTLCTHPISGRRAYVHRVDIKPENPWYWVAFEEHHLEHIGDEEASWEQVEKITAWRPKELVHATT